MRRKYDFTAFRQSINLIQYAATQGYEIDRKKSTKSSAALRHASGDKIIVSRRNGCWVYFSVHDDGDNGTIINFIERRTSKTIGEIGQELSAWLGGGETLPSPAGCPVAIEEHRPDRARVKAVFRKARPSFAHPYLVQERKIPEKILNSFRFRGRIYVDHYGNALFPHYDREGLCGLEIKNIDKSVLVRGSIKGLWTSCWKATDRTLVIAEVAIDAISYHALHPQTDTVYAAVSGAMGAKQYGDLLYFIRKIPNLETIILAMDNDKGGDSIAAKLEAFLKERGFGGKIVRRSPERRGEDWNDVLKTLPN